MYYMTVFNKSTLEIGSAYMCSTSEGMALQEVPDGCDVVLNEFETAEKFKVSFVDGKPTIVKKGEVK